MLCNLPWRSFGADERGPGSIMEGVVPRCRRTSAALALAPDGLRAGRTVKEKRKRFAHWLRRDRHNGNLRAVIGPVVHHASRRRPRVRSWFSRKVRALDPWMTRAFRGVPKWIGRLAVSVACERALGELTARASP